MVKIVLLRHGQSVWNKENRFTGWTDVDLSEQGVVEAKDAALRIKEAGLQFDVAFTSVLKRAIRTLWIVQEELDLHELPVYKSWRLNERHYGALQGLNKTEMIEKFGEQQVHLWRRSYDVLPPALEVSDARHFAGDPLTESLELTVARLLPYWHESIAPAVKSGSRVLIVAHGNSIRALIKYLDNIPDDKITLIEIPTGIPLVYELDADLKPIKNYYLS